MKKIALIALVLSCGLVFSGCNKKTAPEPTPAPTQKPRKADKNVNQEPVSERPFVRLAPREDGKAAIMSIIEVKKQAADLEYEIEYNAGELLQGAFGAIDSLSSLPIKKEILFGSCSTGGKCTYNKDITGGNLTLRFGDPDYTLKTEWAYAENALKEKTFTSRDGKFTLDVSKAKHTANFLLIQTGPGYPGIVEGTVIAGPYIVSPAQSISGTVTVSVRLPLDKEDGKLLGFDGSTWKEWKATVSDRVLTGSGTMNEVFVVVGK